MHKRKDKILSFMLVITLFLTGLILDTAAEDAFFLCNSMEESSLCPRANAVINTSKICGSEILNRHNDMEQQSIELSPSLSLLVNRFFLSLYRHAETIPPFCQTLDGLVTNYIHQSDGKKRN